MSAQLGTIHSGLADLLQRTSPTPAPTQRIFPTPAPTHTADSQCSSQSRIVPHALMQHTGTIVSGLNTLHGVSLYEGAPILLGEYV